MPETRSAGPSGDYFRLPRKVEGTIMTLFMVLFLLALFSPSNIVLSFLGPIGTFARFMNKEHLDLLYTIFYVGIGIRACEAVAARYIALQKGLNRNTRIKWILQTFVIGFPSLMSLTDYKGNRGL